MLLKTGTQKERARGHKEVNKLTILHGAREMEEEFWGARIA